MLQDIGSLLKKVDHHSDDMRMVVDCIYKNTNISIDIQDLLFSTYRGVTYVRIQASGVKKTLLILKKGELENELKKINFILLW